MAATRSKMVEYDPRRDQTPEAPVIGPGSSTNNGPQGLINITNDNANTNIIYGSGKIINNNHVINHVYYANMPNESDLIQTKINSTLQFRYVPQAVYNARLASGCMEGTRVLIINEIEIWIKNPNAQAIFWLAGMAGTGKTAIAWTICSRASKDPDVILGGSFFCSRSTGLPTQRDVLSVVPTLAQLLARQSTAFAKALADELARDPDVLQKQVGAQVEQLLYTPLLALKDSKVPILFVIDALDECSDQSATNGSSDGAQTHRAITAMLESLVDFSRSSVKLPIKFLVTSRPETHIRDTPVSNTALTTVLRLHNVNKEQVAADIRLYISKRLISSPQSFNRFRSDDVDKLARWCDGLFIVAATALQYTLSAGIDAAVERLKTILNPSRDALVTEAVAPVDRMYAVILADAMNVHAARTEVDKLADLRQLLAALLCTRRTLSVAALADLLDRPTDRVRASLSRLHAVIHVPNNDDEPGLCALHASFGDYLLGRAPSHIRISESLGDDVLARACLHVMEKRLQFNVSQTDSSCKQNPLTEPENIVLSLKYACLQWVYHLSGLPEPSRLDKEINAIFCPRFLFWLEVVSVLDRVGRASAMLLFSASLVRLVELRRFLRDAHAFVTSSRQPIEKSAPHIYLSALPFAPKDSLIYKTFISCCKGLVSVETLGIDRHGDRLVMSLTGTESAVTSVAYSSDGFLIAAGSEGGAIRVWDTRTGEETVSPLRLDGGPVLSVAFSLNKNHSLAAGTGTGVVYIWRTLPDQLIPQQLRGHSEKVKSVVFSPNSSLLASCSSDKTIRLWRVETGKQIHLIRAHTAEINAVAFSRTSAILASGSHDQTIRLWNTATGQHVRRPLSGHKNWVISVCFSSNGAKLASGSEDEILLWESQTGTIISRLHGHSGWINSLHFSPSGLSLMSATASNGVRLWTLQQNASQSTSIALDRRLTSVRSATLSPDGLFIALASDDRSVQIWNVDSEEKIVQPLPAPGSVVHSVAVSPNADFIISGCEDHSVRMWNMYTGETRLLPLLQHTGVVLCVAVSPDGRLIASASWDCTIILWDTRTGTTATAPLRGHKRAVSTVAFSHDGRWLASGSLDKTVRIWSIVSGQASDGEPLRCSSFVRTVSFSPNGWLITAGDMDGRNYFWQRESGVALCEPLQRRGDIRSIAFSPDGVQVSSAEGKNVYVRDVRKQHEILVLEGHTDQVLSVAYSANGNFIGTGSKDNTLCLWHAKTGVLIATLHGHDGWVQELAFTPDGRSIVSCSRDMTIRVWDVEAASAMHSSPTNLSAALTSTGLKDGWLLGPAGELLLWVPEKYRGYIQAPPCTMIIGSHQVFVTADQRGLYYGTNWTSCWRKEVVRPSPSARG